MYVSVIHALLRVKENTKTRSSQNCHSNDQVKAAQQRSAEEIFARKANGQTAEWRTITMMIKSKRMK